MPFSLVLSVKRLDDLPRFARAFRKVKQFQVAAVDDTGLSQVLEVDGLAPEVFAENNDRNRTPFQATYQTG